MRTTVVALALIFALAVTGCSHKFALADDAAVGSDSGTGSDASGSGSNICIYGSSRYDDGCQFGP